MPLIFPVTPPASASTPPAWPHYRDASTGLYHPYPHWLGLEFVRTTEAVTAAVAAPAEESRLSRLEVWRAEDGPGEADPADSIVVEEDEVYGISMGRRPDGVLDLFYLRRTVVAPAAGVLLHRMSRDGGRSWSEPEEPGPEAESGPLIPAVRGAGEVRAVRDIFIPGLAHCVTRDGMLFLALQAALPGESASAWLGTGEVTGERWRLEPMRANSLTRPELAAVHPWGLIEVSSNLSTRAFSRFSKTSETPAPAVGPTSPGCIDPARGGFHRAYMTASPPTPPAWQVSTGPLGVSPMPVWSHPQVPTFQAPLADSGGDFLVSSAARMGVRPDGALELFHVEPDGRPAITWLRHTGESASGEWE